MNVRRSKRTTDLTCPRCTARLGGLRTKALWRYGVIRRCDRCSFTLRHPWKVDVLSLIVEGCAVFALAVAVLSMGVGTVAAIVLTWIVLEIAITIMMTPRRPDERDQVFHGLIR